MSTEEKVDKEMEALVRSEQRTIGASRPAGVSAPADASGVNHLAMNCVVPGLGSLVRGRSGLGAGQLGLTLLGLVLILGGHWLFGLTVGAGAWFWSLMSGIGFLRERKLRW